MATFRYRHRSESSGGLAFLAAGAIAGLAAGVIIAQRFGGLSGIRSLVRDRFGEHDAEGGRASGYDADAGYDYDTDTEDEVEGGDVDEVLEERVLEAFRNDPILSERAVDIGAVGDAIVDLTGYVH